MLRLSSYRLGRAYSCKHSAVRTRAQSSDDQAQLSSVINVSTAVGQATLDVLVDTFEDISAEISRVQAEQLKILSRFPDDPVQTIRDLTEDTQSRPLPTVQDISGRVLSTAEAIQAGIDSKLNPEPEKKETVDENQVPDAPDAQEVLDELRADVAVARSLVRNLQQKQSS